MTRAALLKELTQAFDIDKGAISRQVQHLVDSVWSSGRPMPPTGERCCCR